MTQWEGMKWGPFDRVCFIQGENDNCLLLWAQLCGDSLCLKSTQFSLSTPVPQKATTLVEKVLKQLAEYVKMRSSGWLLIHQDALGYSPANTLGLTHLKSTLCFYMTHV